MGAFNADSLAIVARDPQIRHSLALCSQEVKICSMVEMLARFLTIARASGQAFRGNL
jgi:hypothetical protein